MDPIGLGMENNNIFFQNQKLGANKSDSELF